MEEYQFKSINTADHLSLHDCVCKRLCGKDSTLVFDMEWMEVLESHPDNPYDEAHQSGEGKIILKHPSKIEGKIESANKENVLVFSNAGEIDIQNFEVLTFDVDELPSGFKLRLYGLFSHNPNYDYIEIDLEFETSEVMFNELGEKSWFVDWNK